MIIVTFLNGKERPYRPDETLRLMLDDNSRPWITAAELAPGMRAEGRGLIVKVERAGQEPKTLPPRDTSTMQRKRVSCPEVLL